MSSFTPFYSIPETFPTTIADNDPVQHSFIPQHHVKHPKWYFDDADLFFTQRGILFGLHQHKFDNPHFSRRLNHIEPCKTAAKGTYDIIPSYFTRRSIHSTVHNLHPLTLSTKRFFNRHHRMESNEGFGYDLGLRRRHTDGNAENTNDGFNTSIYSTTVSITNHRLNETFGRRNYR